MVIPLTLGRNVLYTVHFRDMSEQTISKMRPNQRSWGPNECAGFDYYDNIWRVTEGFCDYRLKTSLTALVLSLVMRKFSVLAVV